MSELPEGWARTTLGQALVLNYGKSLPATSRKGTGFKVFGSNGVVGENSEAITGAPAIIVGRKGSFGEVHFSEEPCFPIDTTYYVDEFDAFDARFAYYLLQHLPLTEMNRSSAIPGLNRKDAYDLAIHLPPFAEQRRIVAKVDGLTARTARARNELNRIPTLIARYKRQLLELAISGALTHEWRSAQKAQRWNTVKVEEIATATFDGPFGSNLKSADYTDTGVRVVRLENIGSLNFIREKETYIPFKKYQTLKRHTLQADDVLFSSFVSEDIRVCLFPDDLGVPAINKADCFCVRPNIQRCLPKFLAFRLASPGCYEDLKQAVHGATRPRISLSHLKQYEFEIPGIDEQAEIVHRIESAFGWLDRMAADHAAATRLLPKLDAAILAKAFRGELVPQDPNDEPASALLERINVQSIEQSKSNRRGRSINKVEASVRLPAIIPVRAKTKSKAQAMSKSRKDDDVFRKPYLASKLKKLSGTNVQALYDAADLEVADFYKQLAWEIEQGFILDSETELKAA